MRSSLPRTRNAAPAPEWRAQYCLMKIYLAGPLFSNAERGFLDTIAARLRALTAMAAPDCRNCVSIGIHGDALTY